MDWTSLSRLVPELALVIIFVWFTLERDKRQAASEERRDKEWREFLKEYKDSNNLALGRLADEIKANNGSIAAMNGVLIAHDNRTTQAVHTTQPPTK